MRVPLQDWLHCIGKICKHNDNEVYSYPGLHACEIYTCTNINMHILKQIQLLMWVLLLYEQLGS